MQTSIFAPVEKEIALVENKIKSVADVEYPWLDKLLGHVLDGGGKRVRPALTLLGGKFYNYNIDLLISMAAAIELLHTATLVHDDTIDGSAMRRGKPTVANVWGGGVAMLLGDYLFAKSAEVVTSTGRPRVIMLFAQTLVSICNGELEQSFTSFREDQGRQSYFRRIGNKTASMFATATESAGVLSDAPEDMTLALKRYGYDLGMAFQIADDILDFTSEDAELGKPAGSDLLRGTITLPAILLAERRPQDNPIAAIFKDENREQNLKLAIEMIRNSDIILESYRVAQSYISSAKKALEALPSNPCRRVLCDIADYVAERRR